MECKGLYMYIRFLYVWLASPPRRVPAPCDRPSISSSISSCSPLLVWHWCCMTYHPPGVPLHHHEIHHHYNIAELYRHNVHVSHVYTLYITWYSYFNRYALVIATSNYSGLGACILPRQWRRTLATVWDLLRYQRQCLVRWRRAFCSRETPEPSYVFEYS